MVYLQMSAATAWGNEALVEVIATFMVKNMFENII